MAGLPEWRLDLGRQHAYGPARRNALQDAVRCITRRRCGAHALRPARRRRGGGAACVRGLGGACQAITGIDYYNGYDGIPILTFFRVRSRVRRSVDLISGA